MTKQKTAFFKNCLGVFQGGGCRGIALAGALQSAVESGVHFSEVAGASAGSIIAAFVGAGATPKDIVKELSNLNFNNFLQPPEKSNGYRPEFAKYLLGIGLKLSGKKEIASIINFGGIYSSTYIETWIEEKLSKLLSINGRPVKFKDLPLPTYIVATDLLSSSVKIWSQSLTPDENVALAVRSSCSIPLFFQPVISGNNRYVDGGVISNLPAFVFFESQSEVSDRPHSNRILAFQLTSSFSRPNEWTYRTIIHQVANAIVNGAVDLQRKIQDNIYVIPIDTKDIQSTDFEKITEEKISVLLESGSSAVTKYIQEELLVFKDDHLKANLLYDEEEIFSSVVNQIENIPKRLIVIDLNTSWLWKIFPTILYLLLQSVEITVVVASKLDIGNSEDKEDDRRQLLRNLGVSVQEETLPEISGYYFDYGSNCNDSAIIFSRENHEGIPVATRYAGPEHQSILTSIKQSFTILIGSKEYTNKAIELVPVDFERVRKLLKDGVSQYRHEGVSIQYADVNLVDIHLISKFTREFKYL